MIGFFYAKNFTTYTVYFNQSDKYYFGFTGDDIEERLRNNNTNHKGFIGKFNDCIIVYSERFDEKITAINSEKEIKKLEK